MANEKKEFVLRHAFTGPPVSTQDSPVETHFGVPWRIHINQHYNVMVNNAQFTLNNVNDDFNFYLYSSHISDSNLWKIDVTAEFGLITKNGGFMRFEKRPRCFTFTKDSRMHGFVSFARSSDITEYCLIDNKFTAEIRVKIIGMTGISRKRTKNFNEPNGKMTDVCLVVDEKKFHVSKTMLAEQSPVFEAMFFGEFVEAESKEVVIEDTKAESFRVFLSLIYSTDTNITAENVEELMKLADRYDVSCVHGKCEKFLLSNNDVGIAEKLKLSEKYSLTALQKHCLDSLKTRRDLENLKSNMNEMGPLNVKALFEKSLDLLKKYE